MRDDLDGEQVYGIFIDEINEGAEWIECVWYKIMWRELSDGDSFVSLVLYELFSVGEFDWVRRWVLLLTLSLVARLWRYQ